MAVGSTVGDEDSTALGDEENEDPRQRREGGEEGQVSSSCES
jgi:hypothetical protein